MSVKSELARIERIKRMGESGKIKDSSKGVDRLVEGIRRKKEAGKKGKLSDRDVRRMRK